jgi:hypothetical protein
MEHIKHEAGNSEAWICICSNRPDCDGFYPCDKDGNEIEPDKSWIEPLYVCAGCGRIIHCDTLEVIGKKFTVIK